MKPQPKYKKWITQNCTIEHESEEQKEQQALARDKYWDYIMKTVEFLIKNEIIQLLTQFYSVLYNAQDVIEAKITHSNENIPENCTNENGKSAGNEEVRM